jgi:hypothetical protein
MPPTGPRLSSNRIMARSTSHLVQDKITSPPRRRITNKPKVRVDFVQSESKPRASQVKDVQVVRKPRQAMRRLFKSFLSLVRPDEGHSSYQRALLRIFAATKRSVQARSVYTRDPVTHGTRPSDPVSNKTYQNVILAYLKDVKVSIHDPPQTSSTPKRRSVRARDQKPEHRSHMRVQQIRMLETEGALTEEMPLVQTGDGPGMSEPIRYETTNHYWGKNITMFNPADTANRIKLQHASLTTTNKWRTARQDTGQ